MENQSSGFLKIWRDISITKKLYGVIGIMAVLIIAELVTLRFAMNTLSAVRAFVGGESLWSKAQKDAVFSLQRYGLTHDEKDYQGFLDYLSVPDGDHIARTELEKPDADFSVIRRGFLQGHLHDDDILPMTTLLRRFYWISYLDRAIHVWRDGDRLMSELKAEGVQYHELLKAEFPDPKQVATVFDQIRTLNGELTRIEEDFSTALGEGSRWMEHVLVFLLCLAVMTVETIGLSLAFLTSRSLSHGLAELTTAASEIGKGKFDGRIPVRARDEIGVLAEAVNHMGSMLQVSYSELESRVVARTAELAKAVDENAKLYEQTKAALQTREEFLSIASHELRTPLTALYLHLQMLARGLTGTKEQQIAESALGQTKRLNLLLDELMDLTRIRLGKLEIHRENCDISAIICDVASQMSAEAARAGSELTIDAKSAIFGLFDPTRVGQVVTNLVSNAIKYGNGNPISVSVGSQGDQVTIAVRDQGKGIPPQEKERIFGRFERLNEDPGITGLGLGLYITCQIVEAHGGKISVESEFGKGSVFTVTLKREKA